MGSALVTAIEGQRRAGRRPAQHRRGSDQGQRGRSSAPASCCARSAAHGHLNFYGNVEGDDIFKGTTDIVVCDGFVGNVALKSTEGLAKMLKAMIRQEFERSVFTQAGRAGWRMPVLRRFQARVDPRRYNGAALLGLQGPRLQEPRLAPTRSRSAGARTARTMRRATACSTACSDAHRRDHAGAAADGGESVAQAHDRSRHASACGAIAVAHEQSADSRRPPFPHHRHRQRPAARAPDATTTSSSVLAKRGIETSDDWIVERTGIRARHFAAPTTSHCSDLATAAAQRALEAAGCDAADDRPDHRRHLDARHGVPVDGLHRAAQARRARLRGVRRAGGVLGLRLRAERGRRDDQGRQRQRARW